MGVVLESFVASIRICLILCCMSFFVQADTNKVCFVIDEIIFVPTQADTDKPQKLPKEFSFAHKIAKSYLHQCLYLDTINTLLASLNNTAIKKGFITSKFGIAPQDLSGAKLIIQVEIGRIHNITYNSNNFFLSFAKDFSIKQNDVLNLTHLQSSISNLKKMRYVDTTMKITPSKANHSDIIIDVHRKNLPFYGSYIFDNGHLQFDYQHTLLFAWENPLKLADRLQFYLLGALPLDTTPIKSNHSFYGAMSYALPIRRILFELNAAYFYNSYQIPLANLRPVYSGNNTNMDLKLSYALLQTQDYSFSFGLNLGARFSDSFLENIELLIQRRAIIHYSLFLRYIISLPYLQFGTDVSILQGFSLPNAVLSGYNYFVPVLNLHLYRPFQVLKYTTTYTSTIKTQIGSSNLYANDAFIIGGRYTVRGFDRLSYTGQMGVLYRNDLNLFIPFLKQSQIVPSLALDMGYVKSLDSATQAFLAGGGLGAQFIHKNFNLQAWWHFPIYASTEIPTQNFFFSIGLNW